MDFTPESRNGSSVRVRVEAEVVEDVREIRHRDVGGESDRRGDPDDAGSGSELEYVHRCGGTGVFQGGECCGEGAVGWVEAVVVEERDESRSGWPELEGESL